MINLSSISILLVLISLVSCNSEEDLTTNTFSKLFQTKSEKIAFMEKYYSPTFDYVDVEYHIVYYDNDSGRGVPGPSDWYMDFAFKLTDEEAQQYTKDNEVLPYDFLDRFDFLSKEKKWSLKGEKIYYEHETVWINEQNILLMRVST